MKYLLIFILSLNLYAVKIKHLSLVCEEKVTLESGEYIGKDSFIPKGCMLLSEIVSIKLLGEVKDNKIMKILINDLNQEVYILKRDIIFELGDNKNLKYF